MKKLFFSLIIISALVGMPDSAVSAQGKMQELIYKDISLVGIPKKNNKKYDTSFPLPLQGIEKLRQAIDVIYKKSPFSAAKLEVLKKVGQITIAYYPGFDDGKTGSFALAAFFPDFYDKGVTKDGKKSNKKWFVVKVGRHAIKWPPDELAMIIVHELVGHGMQKLRGRLKYIRNIDLECAANLYGERFYQDIKMDKSLDNMVRFRRSLEDHWCSDLKSYMRRVKPQTAAMWDVLNPDVPKLLDIFDEYVKYQYRNGTAGKSIAAAKKMRKKRNETRVLSVDAGGNAEEQYKLGVAFREGLGMDQDVKQALKWFRKAAGQDNVNAQIQLADMYATGQGTPRNPVMAGFWISMAVALSSPGSDRDSLVRRRDRMIAKLKPSQRDSIWKNVEKRLMAAAR